MSRPLARGRAARLAFQRLARAAAPLLFLDLDGTLAPLVDRPARASVPDATRRSIRTLRKSGARVVLVSGRSVAGVLRVARMPVDAVLGDHGGRACIDGRITPWLPADRTRLAAAAATVEALIEATPGILLQRKDRSLAIHLRIAGGHDNGIVREVARRLRASGLRVLCGHRVLDAQLPGVDKGAAVRRWLRRDRSDAVLYAGDDTTDQDAFSALRGRAMTIAVGPRTGGAGFRTRDPATFAVWLARLAAARGHAAR